MRIARIVFLMIWAMIMANGIEAQQDKTKVLVLFYSDNGGTYELAKEVAKGIEKNGRAIALI